MIFISFNTLLLIYSLLKGSPYVPTNNKTILRILKEANLKKDKIFMELGSGDGRVTRLAVTQFGVKGIGFDINPLLVFWSNFLSKPILKDKKIIKFLNQDVLEADFKKADYLYLFLLPELIKKLIPRFNKQLKKRAIIISHGFPIPGWEKKLIKKLDNK
ncbi:MAG: hypothetical protein ACPLRN_04150, partial [Microgenomates group bacterium]